MQHSVESMHKYRERFNKLCAICPHHQINEQLLIQYFYEGLTMMDRSMIDTSSGKALMHKTPAAARHLISNMEIDNLRLENQLIELTSLVRQLVVEQHQPIIATKVCGIRTSVEHPTDMCPTLQETKLDHLESVGAIGGYQYGKQSYQSRPFDNQQFEKQPFQLRPSQGPYSTQQFRSTPNAPQGQAVSNSNLEFQQTMNSSNMQFQQNMKATIQDLKTQIGQLANTVSQLQLARSGNLP
ncbi:hypothetical protein CR513_14715, partial [Mucuna pruriens]